MVKNCLNCGNEFEAKRDSAKYCSDNCRVKWNWKHRNERKKIGLQVIEKRIIELLDKFETKQSVVAAAKPINNYFQQPIRQVSKTPQQWVDEKRNCENDEQYTAWFNELQKSGLPKETIKKILFS